MLIREDDISSLYLHNIIVFSFHHFIFAPRADDQRTATCRSAQTHAALNTCFHLNRCFNLNLNLNVSRSVFTVWTRHNFCVRLLHAVSQTEYVNSLGHDKQQQATQQWQTFRFRCVRTHQTRLCVFVFVYAFGGTHGTSNRFLAINLNEFQWTCPMNSTNNDSIHVETIHD